MNRSRKRPDGGLDSFFRSVYDSLAKKVLEEEAGIGSRNGEVRQAAKPSSAKRSRVTHASKDGAEAADPTYH